MCVCRAGEGGGWILASHQTVSRERVEKGASGKGGGGREVERGEGEVCVCVGGRSWLLTSQQPHRVTLTRTSGGGGGGGRGVEGEAGVGGGKRERGGGGEGRILNTETLFSNAIAPFEEV